MEFLKLDESEDDGKFLSDWDAFFYGAQGRQRKGSTAIRGFYSYYPVEKAKTTAVVVARFTDPRRQAQGQLAAAVHRDDFAEQQSPRRLARLRRNLAAAQLQRALSRTLLDEAAPLCRRRTT